MRAQHQDPEVRNSQRERAELPLFEFESGLSASHFEGAQCETGAVSATATAAPDKAHARRNDPPNSHAAAASVTNLGPTRDLILLILDKCGPQQDQDIIEYFQNTARNDRDWGKLRNVTEQSIRSRRSELVRMKRVHKVGTGKTRAGNACAIWGLNGEKK